MNERKWWWPEKTDEVWAQRIRDDYGITEAIDDDLIREDYADGRKYAITWDHVGDAYSEYEKLADSHAVLVKALEEIAKNSSGLWDAGVARAALVEAGVEEPRP